MKVTLKKYPNRRLYDTENSTYVTLRDVADMIRQGRQVEVIDVKTNEDVTAFILTQIIMEQAKQNNSILPVSLLHLIIRSGRGVLSDFFENYLEKAIESYLGYKTTMDEQFRICLELGLDFSNIAKKTMKDISPFGTFFEGTSDKTDKKEDQ
ncbi:polyhydroxyalkanoate synthesis repressor PhaR [Desulfococcaceae bacterium HSG8]|nr:polyhydroxyalkanoate synthesis repressor PhaR [Desulfococcaceae bacterium HSG8]